MSMPFLTCPRAIAVSLLLPIMMPLLPAEEASTARPPFKQWGSEALKTIDDDLWIPRSRLYAEGRNFERRGRENGRDGREERRLIPAFMWGVGVQLSALAAAAKVEPETYLKQTLSYADAIEVYWLEDGGISGYDVLPGPKDSDRYYDDNAWLVLALAEVFELTGDRKYLEKSEATFRFVMSGHDDKLGGGLYWRETPRESKNTCTNAPAIVSALRLYQLTEKEDYLETARSLYDWTKKTLQDDDGLYLDNIKLDGTIDRRKFTYNSALMLRANCLFHEITGEEAYLEEAGRMAGAAVRQWVRDTGGIADGGRFAHLLLEAFIELHGRDPDPRWLQITQDALVFVNANVRDANGRHASRWDRKVEEPLRRIMLLDLASAARAYWVAADAFAEGPVSANPPE